MANSIVGKWRRSVGVVLVLGALTGVYTVNKFYTYESSVAKILSGDQKTVLSGHLLEARARAAEELVSSSVTSEEQNLMFRNKIESLLKDLQKLASEHPDAQLTAAEKLLNAVIETKAEAMEDLFVQYRNIKSTAFNIYRLAWNNKWMIVAKIVGMVINDLDNLPYHDGKKAVSSIFPKLNQLVAAIAASNFSQDAKISLMGQVAGLKNQLNHYSEVLEKSEKLREKRLLDLRTVAGIFGKYSEQQGRGMLSFATSSHSEVFKTIFALLAFGLFGVIFYAVNIVSFRRLVNDGANLLQEQMQKWIADGKATLEFKPNFEKGVSTEFQTAFRSVEQAVENSNSLRKEDAVVKRLLNVPFILVNKDRQAIFWNSSFTLLSKSRALSETGVMGYVNLVHFSNAQGKSIDPIEKAFVDRKEVVQLALLRSGDDRIAVHAVCTPVFGEDRNAEYVAVHLRDLREENRRIEAEIDRQLEWIRGSVQQISAQKIPEFQESAASSGARKSVVECIGLLKNHALEITERSQILHGQIETLHARMAREAELKRTVHSRMEQIKTEMKALHGEIALLRDSTQNTVECMRSTETKNRLVRTEYHDIRRRSQQLLLDLRESQNTLGNCVQRIDQIAEVVAKAKSNQKFLESTVRKSALLNANNTILGSKSELSPGDVIAVTENIASVLSQFDRSQRFLGESVQNIEQGAFDLTQKVAVNLKRCIKIAADEQNILRAIQTAEAAIGEESSELRDFAERIDSLQQASALVDQKIYALESKMSRLVQIGQASLELHSHLESGFKGILTI